MFPHAAAANHSIFYDAAGRARSVGEVYAKLTRLFDSARDVALAQRGGVDIGSAAQPAVAPPLPPPVTVGVASVKSVPVDRPVRVASASPPIAPVPPMPLMPAVAPVPPASIPPPDTAGVTQAFARAGDKLPPPPVARPSFQSMFTDRVSQPLAQTVTNLWGVPPTGSQSPGQKAKVFDLFTDTRPNERKLLGDKA
jgi:hypothetical protein